MVVDRSPTTRAVVVTGASSGIGRACTLRLGALGFRVFAGVRRAEDHVSLRQRNFEWLTPLFLDVTNWGSIAAAVETVRANVGPGGLAGLVNSAGIVVAGPLEFLSTSEIRNQFEVNVIGTIAVTQGFLPLLRQSRGRIINIGSTGGRVAMPFIGAYTASKFALAAFTDSLRIELRPWQIPVCLVVPSFVATPLWDRSAARANEMIDNLPQEADRLYGPVIPGARRFYGGISRPKTSADDVAKIVARALTARRPRTHYTVGRGATFHTVLFARLPAKLRDFLLGTKLQWAAKRRPS